MMKRYGKMNQLAVMGFLVNALDGGGDAGQAFPRSDAEDLSRGARFIPGEVTLARRRGEHVDFVQNCEGQCCWCWQMPDGARVYHWDRSTFERDHLADHPCPRCGNTNTSGGTVGEGR